MKNLFLFIVTLFLSTLSLWAQYDPQAFNILEAMSKKYKQLNSFKATLVYSMKNEMAKVDEKFTGKISVQGNKFRLILSNQEIINDGKTVWTYIPTAKEVVIDYVDSDEISPSMFYSIYKKGYKYMLLEDKQIDGKLCYVIDLVPESKDVQFFKIRMNIVKKTKSVQNWTLFDKSGNRFQYVISQFVENPKISSTLFTFDAKKHADVEIVDLR